MHIIGWNQRSMMSKMWHAKIISLKLSLTLPQTDTDLRQIKEYFQSPNCINSHLAVSLTIARLGRLTCHQPRHQVWPPIHQVASYHKHGLLGPNSNPQSSWVPNLVASFDQQWGARDIFYLTDPMTWTCTGKYCRPSLEQYMNLNSDTGRYRTEL